MEFKHPNYYKEMRAERRKHQASSCKPQAKPEPSSGSQTSSSKLQASSGKPQAQASSHKLQAP